MSPSRSTILRSGAIANLAPDVNPDLDEEGRRPQQPCTKMQLRKGGSEPCAHAAWCGRRAGDTCIIQRWVRDEQMATDERSLAGEDALLELDAGFAGVAG